VKPFTTGLSWDVGQPEHRNGRENCLQMKRLKNGSVVLNDRDCKDILVYACKVGISNFTINIA
jgi:hypothetical protein